MRYQATKRHGGVLNAHCEVKEANLKSLYTVWFQLYDILKQTNYRDNEKVDRKSVV